MIRDSKEVCVCVCLLKLLAKALSAQLTLAAKSRAVWQLSNNFVATISGSHTPNKQVVQLLVKI